jgi:rhodanese-related sulfurtransferase
MIPSVLPRELAARHAAGADLALIDVRTPREFQELHVPFARNVPLHQLDPTALRGGGAEQTVYVICQGGVRSLKACESLAAAGVRQVVNVDGGTRAWEAAGLPVVRGQRAMSLERQVRIVAGLLVVLGTGLGVWVHVGWLALAAAVGAGLVFAGVTDRCGMALLLARMPWNQVREAACALDPAGGRPGH